MLRLFLDDSLGLWRRSLLSMYKIKIITEGKVVKTTKLPKTDDPKTLLELLIENEIDIIAPCGGSGSCGKCLVKLNGEPALKRACQTVIESDLTVEVLNGEITDEKILVYGAMTELEVSPFLKKMVIKPKKLNYNSLGLDRVIEKVCDKNLDFNYLTYKQLSEVYETEVDNITLTICEEEVIAVEKGDTSREFYGVAIDIGTTTVVGYLWDLSKGERLASSSVINQQSPYGADVISRIYYVMENENGLQELQEKAVDTINEIINNLITDARINKNNIYQVVMVGNTTMNHLFWGLSPLTLGRSPYLPTTQKAICSRAYELSVDINPGGQLKFLPNIAGFVGSDTIGAVLACQLNINRNELLVDLGTNGEIVLAGKGMMLACSTATGPVFEGANISQGMQAFSGAISSVRYKNDRLFYNIIGNSMPKGLCGSGLIEATALMIEQGVADRTGQILSSEQISAKELAERVIIDKDGMKKFIIAYPEETEDGEGVCLTQKDIREVQLAKGAIAAGIKELLNKAEIDLSEIETIYLAGAYGNYVDVESAQIIGLIPQINEEKIIPTGNAAGAGCQMVLINSKVNDQIDFVSNNIDHVELASSKNFQSTYINSMYFERYEAS